MEQMLWPGEEFQRLFNCTFYNVSDVSLEQRRSVPRSIFNITLTIPTMILYVPCLVSIWSRRTHSCYKYMFAMGVLDMINLLIYGPIFGVLQLLGNVFCSAPTFSYLFGFLISLFFVGEMGVEMLLAVNRCMYFAIPEVALRLFPEDKNWTWFWLLIPLGYGLVYGMFGMLFFFSSIFQFIAINPHFGYADDMYTLYIRNWRSRWWLIYNCVYLATLPSVYLIFAVAVWKQSNQTKTLDKRQRTSPRSMFIQVALISFFNCLSCVFTTSVEHMSKNELMGMRATMIAMYVTQVGMFALPPVIYLSLNKSIQKDVWKMLLRNWLKLFNFKQTDKVTKPSLDNKNSKNQNAVTVAKPKKRNQENSELSSSTVVKQQQN